VLRDTGREDHVTSGQASSEHPGPPVLRSTRALFPMTARRAAARWYKRVKLTPVSTMAGPRSATSFVPYELLDTRGEGSRVSRCRTPTSVRSPRPLPGFQAHAPWLLRTVEEGSVPGFGPQPYRDFGHTRVAGVESLRTGIWSTGIPGSRAQHYQEAGHTGTGIPGTTSAHRTGIPGTNTGRNPLCPLTDRLGNSVSNNLSVTTPTRGGARFWSGEGECRRRG